MVIVGSDGKNDEFQPQNEFMLEPWIEIYDRRHRHLDHQGRALPGARRGLTIGTMMYIANRMQREPNKVQMAVEVAYDLTRNNITGGNIPDEKLAQQVVPVPRRRCSSSSGSRT